MDMGRVGVAYSDLYFESATGQPAANFMLLEYFTVHKHIKSTCTSRRDGNVTKQSLIVGLR